MMTVLIVTNLSTIHYPAPPGEGPYMEGEEREVDDKTGAKMIAAKIATLPNPKAAKKPAAPLKPGEIPPAPHSAASTVEAVAPKTEPTKPIDKPGK